MVGRHILKKIIFLLRKYPGISSTVCSPAVQERLAPGFTQPAAECAWGVALGISVLLWARKECTQKKRKNDRLRGCCWRKQLSMLLRRGYHSQQSHMAGEMVLTCRALGTWDTQRTLVMLLKFLKFTGCLSHILPINNRINITLWEMTKLKLAPCLLFL